MCVRLRIIAAVLCALSVASAPARAERYVDPVTRISFEVPAGWTATTESDPEKLLRSSCEDEGAAHALFVLMWQLTPEQRGNSQLVPIRKPPILA